MFFKKKNPENFIRSVRGGRGNGDGVPSVAVNVILWESLLILTRYFVTSFNQTSVDFFLYQGLNFYVILYFLGMISCIRSQSLILKAEKKYKGNYNVNWSAFWHQYNYTPVNKIQGVYRNHSVCPSLCLLSVCLSVCLWRFVSGP